MPLRVKLSDNNVAIAIDEGRTTELYISTIPLIFGVWRTTKLVQLILNHTLDILRTAHNFPMKSRFVAHTSESIISCNLSGGINVRLLIEPSPNSLRYFLYTL